MDQDFLMGLETLGGSDSTGITFMREKIEGDDVLYLLLGPFWPIKPGLYRLDALHTWPSEVAP